MVQKFQSRGSGRSSSSYQYTVRGRSRGDQIASLRYLPNGVMLQMETPFHRDFMDTFKKSIVSKKRIWDNNDKCWYVVRDQLDKLTHIMDKYFDETILLDFPALEMSTDAWGKLHLVEGAPVEVIKAVYKALALKHHPDRGGDAGVMQTINAAYKELMGDFTNGDND